MLDVARGRRGAADHARRRHLDRRQRRRARASSSTPHATSTGSLSIDPEAGTAVVQPGVVHAGLQRAAAPHGLRFGPDPSTHTALHDRRDDRQQRLRLPGAGLRPHRRQRRRRCDVAFGTGELATLDGPGRGLGRRRAGADGRHLGHVRTEFGRFGRQVSGYSLEHLLPERGRSVDRFLVGSEGTLGGGRSRPPCGWCADEPDRRARGARLRRRWPRPPTPCPALLAAGAGRLIACEGLDARIVDLVRAPRAAPCPTCRAVPAGCFVEVAGAGGRRAGRGAWSSPRPGAWATGVVADPAEPRRAVADPRGRRRAGRAQPADAGVLRLGGRRRPARAPRCLAARLRRRCCGEHGLDGVPYGHFGDGCVHVRIDFPFDGEPAGARLPRVPHRSARQAARQYGGSLSGEHGDGRARSELLPLMYDEESIAAVRRGQGDLRPRQPAQPRRLVDPAPLDADLRPARPRLPVRTALRLVHDGGSLGDAVHRCTGVGKCVRRRRPAA